MRGSRAQPLVGRHAELQRLESRLAAPRSGTPTGAVVVGEAGIGKSRLVAELAHRAESRSLTVLAGSCLHLSAGSAPLAAISGAVRRAVVPMDKAQRRKLLYGLQRDLAPAFSWLLHDVADLQSHPGDAPVRQQRIFTALLELLERLARRERLLLVIEDLHWADESTADFLRFALRNGDPGIIPVVTVRSEAAEAGAGVRQLLGELERGGELERIELAPLTAEEIGALVGNLIGRRLQPAESRRLRERSDGNPYFAQELALANPYQQAGVPPSLQDVLLARFATMSADVQALLRALAVLGREASEDLLDAASARPDSETEPLLREAIAARLLEAPEVGQPVYRFRHALTREAIYADLLPSERRRLHLRAARALETTNGGEDGAAAGSEALLALHWEHGGDVDRALVAHHRASRVALSAGALGDAFQHSRAAIQLWDQAGAEAQAETGAPGVLHLGFAMLAHANGRYEEAIRALETSHALGVPRDLDERISMLEYRCNLLWSLGDHPGAALAADEAMRAAPASRRDLRARVHRMDAGIHLVHGDAERALPSAADGLEHARASGDRAVERYLQGVIAFCHLERGDVDGALVASREAYELDAGLDFLGTYSAGNNHATLLAACGRYEDVLKVAEQATAEIDRLGLERTHGQMLGNLRLLSLTRLGRLHEADVELAELNASNDLLAVLGVERLVFAAELRLRQGSLAESEALVARAREGLDAWTQEWTSGTLSVVEAELGAWLGRPAGVLERLEELTAQLTSRISTSRLRLLTAALRCSGEALRGRRGRDPALVRRINELYGESEQLAVVGAGRVSEWDALLSQARAEAALVRDDDPIEAWTATVALWDEAAMPYDAAYARCRLGEHLLGGRRRALAGNVLREAHAIACDIGAHAVADMASTISQRGRLEVLRPPAIATPRDSVPAKAGEAGTAMLAGLSAREREVLGLIAAGLTNRQIADRLFISEKTAATHVSNILGKLQASSRAQAAAMLFAAGAHSAITDQTSR